MKCMKSLIALGAAAIFSLVAADAAAQVSLQLDINNTSFIQYEPVYAKIVMRNYSSKALAFGETQELSGKLKFEIEDAAGRFLPLINSEQPPMVGVILAPGATKTVTFVLSKYYSLQAKGKYKVKAFISHPQLKSEYESNDAFFSIVSGNSIYERTVGVPDYANKNANPASKVNTRKYSLFDFFDGHSKVYALYVEDERQVYAVRRLGFDMGSSLRPNCEIDSMSRLHILLPVSPKVFSYFLYDIDGKLDKREIHMKTSTTPMLVANKDDGTVMIVGGRPARKDLDYEEYKDLPFMPDDLKKTDPNSEDE